LPPDPVALAAMAAEYGIEILGPPPAECRYDDIER
jgi:hypothetical protein